MTDHAGFLTEVDLEDFAPPVSRKGREPVGYTLDFARELTPADLVAGSQAPRAQRQIAPLQQLRDSHHMAARLIAQGKKLTEVAIECGRGKERLQTLMQDPSFLELIEYYRAQVMDNYSLVHEELAGLGRTAVHILQERLEDNPDGFSSGEIRKLAEFALDRTLTQGSAPKVDVTPASVVVNFITPGGVKANPGVVLDGEFKDLP